MDPCLEWDFKEGCIWAAVALKQKRSELVQDLSSGYQRIIATSC